MTEPDVFGDAGDGQISLQQQNFGLLDAIAHRKN